MRGALPLLACAGVLLAGCGGPSQADVRGALERGWAEQTGTMAAAAGLRPPPGSDAGLTSGLAETSRTVAGVAHKVGGIGGVVVEAVVQNDSQIAADFGAPGAKGLNDRIQLALAHGWSVSRLEVLAQRPSGDEVVARVRYDVSAEMARGRQTVAAGLLETVRLVRRGGRWTVADVERGD